MGVSIVSDETKRLKEDIKKLTKKRDELYGKVNVKAQVNKLKLEIKALEVQKTLLGESLKVKYESEKEDLDNAIREKKNSSQKEIKLLNEVIKDLQEKANTLSAANNILRNDVNKNTENLLALSRSRRKEEEEIVEIRAEIQREWKELTAANEAITKYEVRVKNDEGVIKEAASAVKIDVEALHKEQEEWENKRKKEEKKLKKDQKALDTKFNKKFAALETYSAELDGREKECGKREHQNEIIHQQLEKFEQKLFDREKEVKKKERDLARSWKSFENEKKKYDWNNREKVI